MTRIAFSDGRVVMRDGKVGTEAACCCGQAACSCGDMFRLDGSNVYELVFTFGDSTTATYCISAMPLAVGGVAEHMFCVDGQYEVVIKPGNCLVRLFFSLGNFPDCQCDTGESCDYILDGWENIGACDANDEVVNVEDTFNSC